MTIDEFLAGMAEHHPMIHRRALDLNAISAGVWEARVICIKWRGNSCEVYLKQLGPERGKRMVTLYPNQLKMSNSEWGDNLERIRRSRAESAAWHEKQRRLKELAYAQAELDRANARLAKLQLEEEEREHYIRILQTTNNPQGEGN